MNRWGALAVLLAFVAAAALRVPMLDHRPLHNDEAVNATKVAELWEQGRYVYDHDEYHGPTLHYATAPFLSLSGARNAGEIPDAYLRAAPVFFGIAILFLLLLFADGLGSTAIAWAAIFAAVSPAMVFYSRYFIHEMLLIFFSALAIGSAWKYSQKRTPKWAALTGAGLGLMIATKETFVISFAAMAMAGAVTGWRLKTRAKHLWNIQHIALGAGVAIALWLLFFTSFFTNFGGLVDSVRTYLPWLKRAGGESPHIHPWHFYLQRLIWFHPVKGPAWSEGLIVALALVGTIRSLMDGKSGLRTFLACYTLFLAAAYSAISYKTPWCLLNFYLGMILLAGVGAAAITDLLRHKGLRVTVTVALLALTGQLAWQAWRASFIFAADRRNPYVYAQTLPDLLALVQKVESLSKSSPAGHDTAVKVITQDGDYWPLPWYLRRFKNIGWYDALPADPYAPIMIVSAKLDAQLDEKSNRKWVMAGFTELRPKRFLELYVKLELWKKYVATLPPQRD